MPRDIVRERAGQVEQTQDESWRKERDEREEGERLEIGALPDGQGPPVGVATLPPGERRRTQDCDWLHLFFDGVLGDAQLALPRQLDPSVGQAWDVLRVRDAKVPARHVVHSPRAATMALQATIAVVRIGK